MLVTTGIQKQKNAAGLQNIHELSAISYQLSTFFQLTTYPSLIRCIEQE